MEDAPTAFFDGLLRGAAGDQGPPVIGLQFDVEPCLAQRFQRDQRLTVNDRLVGG